LGSEPVITLDTHIWVWWVDDSPQLSVMHRRAIEADAAEEIGVSVISCWEVALLVARGRLTLRVSAEQWIADALDHPRIRLLDLTPSIAVESTRLPGDLHRDPADQIIVATARAYESRLVTADRRILDYPHVRTVVP
jgi:PIN domain nuclease of toxin-antitoxin system